MRAVWASAGVDVSRPVDHPQTFEYLATALYELLTPQVRAVPPAEAIYALECVLRDLLLRSVPEPDAHATAAHLIAAHLQDLLARAVLRQER